MNTTRIALAASMSATMALFACEHDDQTPVANPAASVPAEPHQGATNAQAPNVDSAIVEQLSTARCDREQTCNNVGGGQKFASRDVCMNQMRGSLANDLNGYNCPRGIAQEQLQECMSAIRGERCDHPLDTIARLDRCRTGELCMK
jgi:hypothetical protein